VDGRVTLIAGTNSGATRDVIRYSQIAEQIGYDALMVAVPPYSRPNQRELLAHYAPSPKPSACPSSSTTSPGAPAPKSATT
jgi:4-hydroxy-tetrahydrodipicolinate synthase